MKKIVPHPVLSVILLVVWLLVEMSLRPGTLLVGIALAVVIPLVTGPFWPRAPRIKRYRPLFRYIVIFLWDVLVANIKVAIWIAGPQRRLRPRFLYVPLEVEHPFTITVLASTISLTPGTVSSHIDGDRTMLVVHCLHTRDDEATVREIKERYEKPLMEIFE